MYARFYREAQHALPELIFRNDDEVRVARARRLPSSSDAFQAGLQSLLPAKKVDQNLRYFQDRLLRLPPRSDMAVCISGKRCYEGYSRIETRER